jgi:hypothetical protein
MGEELKEEVEELSSSAELSQEHDGFSDPSNPENGDVKSFENTDKADNAENILKYLKEENQAMRRASQEARRESIALKSKLDQVIVAAQEDIEMGEQDMSTLQKENSMLKLRLEQETKSNKSLEREHEKLKSKLLASKSESEALHHEFKQLSRDHETQEAKWSFDRAELAASKKHVKALEEEIKGLRTITHKFTESSTTQSLDYRSGLDALRREKEMAEYEIEKVLDRNKNQAALLQRLEKRLNQVEANSDAQIEHLQKQLNEERKKNIRFGKAGGMSSPPGSAAASFQTPPSKSQSDGMALPAVTPPRNSSRSRTDKMNSTNKKYTSLKNLLLDEAQTQKQALDKPEVERSESERNLTQALAERESWKRTNSIDSMKNTDDLINAATAPIAGPSGTSQASFLDAVIQKNKKTGFWDKLFGGDQSEGTASKERVSATEFLADEIHEVVLENQRLEAEREKKTKEREKKARQLSGPLGSNATVSHSPNQPKTPNTPMETKTNGPEKNAKVEMTMDTVEDIDLDTLRRMATERTKGMTEEDLNNLLDKRRSSQMSRMSGASDFSHDEFADDWDEEDEDEEVL